MYKGLDSERWAPCRVRSPPRMQQARLGREMGTKRNDAREGLSTEVMWLDLLVIKQM